MINYELKLSLTSKIYISGPMTGYVNYNYESFNRCEHDIAEFLEDYYDADIDRSHLIFNPAKIDKNNPVPFSHPREYYMSESIKGLITCDNVVVLDGWMNSPGARCEILVAREMGMNIVDKRGKALSFDDKSEGDNSDIFKIADGFVNGARIKQYGHPSENFKNIGRIWGSILKTDDISPETVGLMMIGLKIARESFKPHLDNRVDICGYAKTLHMIIDFNYRIDRA